VSKGIQLVKMPQVKIIAKNFMDMVASLPAIKLDKLYNNVFICEAILRLIYVSMLLNFEKIEDLTFLRWCQVFAASCQEVCIADVVH